MDLTGRVALVTGGSRGIGKGIVQRLAKHGAKVAFVYQSNQAAADGLVAELTSAGREAIAIQGNVAQKTSADTIVEMVLAKWGKIDILVNNAGIVRDVLLAQM